MPARRQYVEASICRQGSRDTLSTRETKQYHLQHNTLHSTDWLYTVYSGYCLRQPPKGPVTVYLAFIERYVDALQRWTPMLHCMLTVGTAIWDTTCFRQAVALCIDHLRQVLLYNYSVP